MPGRPTTVDRCAAQCSGWLIGVNTLPSYVSHSHGYKDGQNILFWFDENNFLLPRAQLCSKRRSPKSLASFENFGKRTLCLALYSAVRPLFLSSCLPSFGPSPIPCSGRCEKWSVVHFSGSWRESGGRGAEEGGRTGHVMDRWAAREGARGRGAHRAISRKGQRYSLLHDGASLGKSNLALLAAQ